MAEETELDLYQQYAVTLDSLGNGTITGVGPVVYGERWEIEATQTTVPNSVALSQLTIFLQGQSAMVEGTNAGNLDNSDTKFSLRNGQFLRYQYTGGDAGAIGQITIRGRRFIRGRRGY